MHALCSTHLILFDLISLITHGKVCKSWRSSLSSILHPPFTSAFINLKILITVLKHPQSVLFHQNHGKSLIQKINCSLIFLCSRISDWKLQDKRLKSMVLSVLLSQSSINIHWNLTCCILTHPRRNMLRVNDRHIDRPTVVSGWLHRPNNRRLFLRTKSDSSSPGTLASRHALQVSVFLSPDRNAGVAT
jgi:hypothetical protein